MSVTVLPETHVSQPEQAPGLPLSNEDLQARETRMMERTNWRENHSVPSAGEHYRYMWKWDSLKGIVINARRGDPDRAALEFKTLEKYREPSTGFLPNKIFATTDKKTWRDYPEAWFFNDNTKGSSYTQPPIAAWAAMETYRSFVARGRESDGLDFLKAVYGTAEDGNYTGLQGEYAYFINHRQNSADNLLIGIVHPNETGRDSDEANKPWLTHRKTLMNPQHEWLKMQWLGRQLGWLGRDPEGQRVDWIPEQTRPKYWVNDVMFNSLYASNLRYMADVANVLAESATEPQQRKQYAQDIETYRKQAAAVEMQILTDMWDEKQSFFYNLDKSGNKIAVDSVTGLFPLLLENINKEQAEALLDKLEDPEWFATPYPIPSHAVRSRFYDPHPIRHIPGVRGLVASVLTPSRFKKVFTPPWSGPVWISMNHLLVEEGLVPWVEAHAESEPELAQRAMKIGRHIIEKTVEMLAINAKSMECYAPTTGAGIRVEDFMWSNIGLHFEKYLALEKRMRGLAA